jgi:hypothetical protein
MTQVFVSRICNILFVLILATLGVQAAFCADFWEKKDYTKWSEKECRKLLSDSPWAKPYILTETVGPRGETRSANSLGQATRTVAYQIQLYSALPIRQAIVRQFQITQGYEKLSHEQKSQLDRQAEELLTADNSDVVVLNISYATDYQPYDLEISHYWQIQTADLLKSSTYLGGSAGTKVPISNYVVMRGAQRGFRFIFPRKYEGREILGPKDKSLVLEFLYPVVNPVLGNLNDKLGFVEFKTKKMVFKGKIEY